MPQPRELTDVYRLEKILASSRGASVLGGRELASGRPVVIKLINVPQAASAAAAESAVARFGAYATALAALRHPNLPAILDWGLTPDGGAFLVMEPLSGFGFDTLARRSDGGGGDDLALLPDLSESGSSSEAAPARTLPLLDQATAGLAELAAHGVAHFNISPGNLFVAETPQGSQIKLLGLGTPIFYLGRPWLDAETGRYRAPELARPAAAMAFAAGTAGAAPGPALADWHADCYSLALTVCNALGATVAFGDAAGPIVQMPLALSFELANDEALRRILEACLRPLPPQRPAHAAIRDAFRLALGRDPAPAPRVAPGAGAPAAIPPATPSPAAPPASQARPGAATAGAAESRLGAAAAAASAAAAAAGSALDWRAALSRSQAPADGPAWLPSDAPPPPPQRRVTGALAIPPIAPQPPAPDRRDTGPLAIAEVPPPAPDRRDTGPMPVLDAGGGPDWGLASGGDDPFSLDGLQVPAALPALPDLPDGGSLDLLSPAPPPGDAAALSAEQMAAELGIDLGGPRRGTLPAAGADTGAAWDASTPGSAFDFGGDSAAGAPPVAAGRAAGSSPAAGRGRPEAGSRAGAAGAAAGLGTLAAGAAAGATSGAAAAQRADRASGVAAGLPGSSGSSGSAAARPAGRASGAVPIVQTPKPGAGPLATSPASASAGSASGSALSPAAAAPASRTAASPSAAAPAAPAAGGGDMLSAVDDLLDSLPPPPPAAAVPPAAAKRGGRPGAVSGAMPVMTAGQRSGGGRPAPNVAVGAPAAPAALAALRGLPVAVQLGGAAALVAVLAIAGWAIFGHRSHAAADVHQEAEAGDGTTPPPVRLGPSPAAKLAEASSYLIMGRDDDARVRQELHALTFADQGELGEGGCRQLAAIEQTLAADALERVPQDLAAGLRAGDLGTLQTVVEVAGPRDVPPSQAADFVRASNLVQQYTAAQAAAARGDHAGVLDRFHAMEGLSRSLRDPLGLRDKAAVAIEAQADALARDGKYDQALAQLEPVRRAWPERGGVKELAKTYESAAANEQQQLAILDSVPAFQRRRKPSEGLELLRPLKPTPHLAQRVSQAKQDLEAQLAQLDAQPPAVALRDGYVLDYSRGQVVTLSFRVTDDYEVKSVRLFARPQGGSMRELQLQHDGLGYTVDIPPSFHQNNTVDFYVVATDLSGHEGMLGSKEKPLQLKRRQGFERLLQ